MWHDFHAIYVDDTGIGQDSPVEKHPLPSQRRVVVIVENYKSLDLEARSERGGGSENYLATDRDPSGSIRSSHFAGSWA